MENKDIKVLVLDIDGTLTNSNKDITPRTMDALMDIMKRGHKVVLASGRPTPGLRRYERELSMKENGGYLLSFNGARIEECGTGEVIYAKTLSHELIPELYEFALEHDCGLLTYEGDTIITGTRWDEYMNLESTINQMEVKFIENFKEYVTFDVHKCLMTAPVDVAEGYMETLKERFPDLSIYRSEPFFIEIMPKNIDKAASLEQMLSKVGLYHENTICCGDGFNDISMIRYAAVGVAMANAQPQVKEAADFITASNNDDGIADVIEKFIL